MSTATTMECPACKAPWRMDHMVGDKWACACGLELPDTDPRQQEVTKKMAERREREKAAADVETAREKKVAADAADRVTRETAENMRICDMTPTRVGDRFGITLAIGTVFPVAEILKDVADACRETLRQALLDFKKNSEDFQSLARLAGQLANLKSDLKKMTLSLAALKEKYEHELCAGREVSKLEREQLKVSDELPRLEMRATTLARVLEEARARTHAAWDRRHTEVIAQMKSKAGDRLINAKAVFVSRGGSAAMRELLVAWHVATEAEQGVFRFPLALDLE